MGTINPTSGLTPPGQPKPFDPSEFKSGSIPAVTSFKFHGAEPPSPLYVRQDDQLVVNAISDTSNFSVNITARLLLPLAPSPGQPDYQPPPPTPPSTSGAGSAGKSYEGPVEYSKFGMVGGPAYILVINTQLLIKTVATPFSVSIPLAEGYLLSVAINTAALPIGVGRTAVRAFLGRQSNVVNVFNVTEMLISDTCDTNYAAAWPYGRFRRWIDDVGDLISATVANPAAGADFVLTFLTNSRIRLITVSALLTTSAAVATRSADLTFKLGGNIICDVPPAATQAASLVTQYSWSIGATTTADATGLVNAQPLPNSYVPGNTVIGTSTKNIQAADQWSAVSYLYELWWDGI